MPAKLIVPRSNAQHRTVLGGRKARAPKKRPKIYWAALVPAGVLAFYLHHVWSARSGLDLQLTDIKLSSPPTLEVRCPQCTEENGIPTRGRPHPDNPDLWLPCPVCFGAGQRLVMRPNASTQEICPQCAGMGRFVQEGRVVPCEKCGEWGIVETATIKHSVLIPDPSDPDKAMGLNIEAPPLPPRPAEAEPPDSSSSAPAPGPQPVPPPEGDARP